MNWINVENAGRIGEIKELSHKERILIFKYSPNCLISYVMKSLFEREWHETAMRMKAYLVNIIENKELSRDIAEEFGVEHHSPQILIIEKGKCIFFASHGKANMNAIKQFAN